MSALLLLWQTMMQNLPKIEPSSAPLESWAIAIIATTVIWAAISVARDRAYKALRERERKTRKCPGCDRRYPRDFERRECECGTVTEWTR